MTELPISLYFQFNDSKDHASLETVGEPAIAWSKTIKEVAFVFDPSVEVEVDLVNGTEGSLFLNSVAKIKGVTRQDIRVAIVTTTIWLLHETSSWTVGAVYDYLIGPDAPPETSSLSDEDKKAIAEEVVKHLERGLARESASQFARSIQKDEAISGVGATPFADQVPAIITPKSRLPPIVVDDAEKQLAKRDRTQRLRILVVKPVLMGRFDRSWRFRGPWGEFGAIIRDSDFLRAVRNGSARLPLMEGITLDVELRTIETLKEGIWQNPVYEVIKIYEVGAPESQRDLIERVFEEDEDSDE